MPMKKSPTNEGNQNILGSEVHPSKKNPIGKVTDPTIIGGSRFSGCALPPCLSKCGANTS